MVEITMNPVAYLAVCGAIACSWAQVGQWQDAATRTITYRDQTWELAEPQKTSDGFLLATGFLVDPETGEHAQDEAGFPIIHSFFLGRAS
jgi:hypothetical protein